MSDGLVGNVVLRISADLNTLSSQLRTKIPPIARTVGKEAGDAFSEAFRKQVVPGVTNAVKGALRDARELVRAESLKVSVDADTTAARAEIQRLGSDDHAVSVRVQADTAAAREEIQRLGAIDEAVRVRVRVDSEQVRAELQALTDSEIKVKVRLDLAQARAELDRFSRENHEIHVGLNFNTAEASAQLEHLAGTNIYPQVRFNTAQIQAALDAAVAGVDRVIDLEVRADTTRAREEIDHLNGHDVDVDVGADTSRAREEIDRLSRSRIDIGIGGGGAGGGPGELIGVFQALSIAMAGVQLLLPALIQGIQGLAGASAASAIGMISLGSAVLVTKLAFDGVKDAYSALEAAENASKKSAAQVAAQQLAVAKASEAVTTAQTRVADAVRQASQAQERAAQQVQSAERSLGQAQREARQAQLDLTQARVDASRALQDLRDKAAGGALAERAATLSLASAREEEKKTRADPKATALQREQAKLAVDEAIFGLAQQRKENARLSADRKAADKAGVEGSKQVQSAKEKVRSTTQGVGDAEQALSRARSAQTEALRSGLASIEAAKAGVRDALRSLDVAKTSGGVGAAAVAKLKAAMDELSPSAQKFTRYIFSLKGEFKKLQTAASDAVLPGVQSAIQMLSPYLPKVQGFITSIGKAVGGMATAIASAFVSKDGRSFFEMIARTSPQLITNFGSTVASILKIIMDVLSVAGPMTARLSKEMDKFFKNLATSAGSAEGQAKIKKFFEDAYLQVKALVELAGALGRLVMTFTTGASGNDGSNDPASGIKNVTAAVDKLNAAVKWAYDHAGLMKAVGIAIALAVMYTAGPLLTIAAAIYLVITNWDELKKAVSGTATYLAPTKKAWEGVKESLERAWNTIKTAVTPELEKLKKTIQEDVIPSLQRFSTAVAPIVSWLVDHLAPVVATVFATIVRVVKDALKVVSGVIDVVTGVITGNWSLAWDGIKKIFSGAWDALKAVVKAGMAVIGALLNAGFDVLKMIWSKISGWFSAAGSAIAKKSSEIWDSIKNYIVSKWTASKDFIVAIWNTISGWFTTAGKAIGDKTSAAWEAVKKFVSDKWSATRNAVSAVWESIKGFFSEGARIIGQKTSEAWEYVKRVALEKWNALKSGIDTTWTSIKTIFTNFGKFIDEKVVSPFKTGVSNLAKAWDGLKNLMKTPIKGVIDIVNHGIIDTFNGAAGFFHVPKIPKYIPYPPGFAQGGLLRGPGGGTDDKIHAMVSNGEYVVRANAVRQLGVGFMDVINSADKHNIAGDPSSLVVNAKYADGGVVQKVKSWLPSVDPKPYIWGGVGPGGYDCSGLAGEVWNRLTGHDSYHRRFVTTSDFTKFGFKPGTGKFTIGVDSSHMAGNLDGLGFEAASSRSGIKVGSNARSPLSFPKRYYLGETGGAGFTNFGSGGGGGVGGGLGWVGDHFDPVGWLRNGMSTAVNGLIGKVGLGDSFLGKVIKAVPTSLIDGIASVVKFKGDDYQGGTASNPGGSGVERWASLVQAGLATNGLSRMLLPKVLAQMKTESGGNPNAVQGNIGDINNKTGNLARGLMQVIPPTFKAYHIPGTSNDIFDPRANIYAALNYAKSRYGSNLRGLGEGHGYDSGGWLQPGSTLVHNQTGRPEAVLNPSQWASIEKIAASKMVASTSASGGDTHIHVTTDNYNIAKDIAEKQRYQRIVDSVSSRN